MTIGTKMMATISIVRRFSSLPAASYRVIPKDSLIFDGSMYGNIPMNPVAINDRIVTETDANASPILFLIRKSFAINTAASVRIGTIQKTGVSAKLSKSGVRLLVATKKIAVTAAATNHKRSASLDARSATSPLVLNDTQMAPDNRNKLMNRRPPRMPYG